MKIIGIDPGSKETAYIEIWDDRIGAMGKIPNHDFLLLFHRQQSHFDACFCERTASYGKPVGEDVFETVRLEGALWGLWTTWWTPEPFRQHHPVFSFKFVPRRKVKQALCGTDFRITDAVIRQRLIDLWGGKEKAIGRKGSPGPLYGLKGDLWSALAVLVAGGILFDYGMPFFPPPAGGD